MAEKKFITNPEVTQREIDNAQKAGALGAEAIVLLRNENNVLPLKKGINIALYGNGARNTIKGGTGSGDVNSRENINIENGLVQEGFVITSKKWIDKNEQTRNAAKKEYLDWIQKESERTGKYPVFVTFDHPFEEPDIVAVTLEDVKESNTDTAVFVISRNSGEGADRKNVRGDYQIFENEKENLKFLGQNYKNVIVVLNVGGVMDLTEVCAIEGISAIVLMSQLGNLGGKILAQVLQGTMVPSGRLADTWACNYMDYPSSAEFSFNNGNVDDDYYKDGIFVGYRYFDTFNKKVLFPFGFGLNYTLFDSKVTGICQNKDEICVKVMVENTGKDYAGKEVIQVYVSGAAGNIQKPYQELKGFGKTKELAPGEKQELQINIPLVTLASYSEEKACWIIEKGDYEVRVGTDSKNTKVEAVLKFNETVITEKCKNLLKLDCDLPEMQVATKGEKCETAELSDKIIVIDTSAIKCKENKYQSQRVELKNNRSEKLTLQDVRQGKATVEELTAQLTVEEMAALCVGEYNTGMAASIVGAASAKVPGAAGETTALLAESRGINKLITADGPAGVRLTPHFKTDKNGNLLPGGEVFGDEITPFKDVPADAIDYYQYCTAIPIGWALAQTWNTQAVEEIGEMIGGEMELFNVDLWLAPAQNIHRNPLCGRNFEYYSEDPLLTGKISAAITRGVQKHKGRGTTIKHFAANNQEENRYFVNAHISERALREIYLKGFEIAVKESQPLSIMTSYNLLNGKHTPNQKDLVQHILRDEWGFNGLVMTDWFTSQDMPGLTGKYGKPKYPISASSGCIYAGNDLQMPGCKKNVDDIVEAVNSGKELDGFKITLADLQFCTVNILKVIALCEG